MVMLLKTLKSRKVVSDDTIISIISRFVIYVGVHALNTNLNRNNETTSDHAMEPK